VTEYVVPDSALVGVIFISPVVTTHQDKAGDIDIETVWPSISVIDGKP
jgi:hypothetical protein